MKYLLKIRTSGNRTSEDRTSGRPPVLDHAGINMLKSLKSGGGGLLNSGVFSNVRYSILIKGVSAKRVLRYRSNLHLVKVVKYCFFIGSFCRTEPIRKESCNNSLSGTQDLSILFFENLGSIINCIKNKINYRLF